MTTTARAGSDGSRTDTGLDVVTGAFSYSGRAIARRLLDDGRSVRTLTGHPQHADPATAIQVRPLDFSDLPALVRDLEGVTTLYNTYWVRFAHGRTSHEQAVENSRTLFHAARRAGVQRIVHVSITNPAIESPYPYFRGKALVERALAETGVSYAILRPAILFGNDGVLVNNIAWLLRHLPVFGVGGRGDYRIRPIHVDDLARLCIDAAAQSSDRIIDAVGPDRPTFLELVEEIRSAVGSRARVVHVPRVAPAADLVGAQPRCATCCSRPTSTTRWPTASPTPTGLTPRRPRSPTGSPSTARRSESATPTSSIVTSTRGRHEPVSRPDECFWPMKDPLIPTPFLRRQSPAPGTTLALIAAFADLALTVGWGSCARRTVSSNSAERKGSCRHSPLPSFWPRRASWR